MGNILYIVAVLLVLFWAIGFFVFTAGAIIHVLLVLAIISILIKVIGGSKAA